MERIVVASGAVFAVCKAPADPDLGLSRLILDV